MKKVYISPKATAFTLFTDNAVMTGSPTPLPQFGGGAADDSGNL